MKTLIKIRIGTKYIYIYIYRALEFSQFQCLKPHLDGKALINVVYGKLKK